MKGSTVLLHWNYTYFPVDRFGYQRAGYINDASKNTIEILARSDGSRGQLKAVSVIRAPFTGRVDTIRHNTTLVIKNVQYNDTSYNFSSFVQVHILGNPPIRKQMKPVIKLTVKGSI